MPKYLLFETMTGLIVDEFEPVEGPADVTVNTPETVDVTINLAVEVEAARDWRNLGQAWKMSIAYEHDGKLLGGPIMPHDFDDDAETLKLTARGILTWFDHLFVLPPAAETQPLVDGQQKPIPGMNTNLSGLEYGTIVKRLIQQACSWPGAGIPVAYPADRAGTRERAYEALDFKTVFSAIEDITQVIGGPDVRMPLRRRDDRFVEWVLETGTDAQPRLQADVVHSFNATADEPSARGLKVTTDPSNMADIAWATAGRNEDTALVARARSTVLRDAGVPLLMVLDSSHSDVSVQSTLNGYASEALRTAYLEAQFWTFEVNLALVRLGDISEGDICELKVADHGYIPAGTYKRRIAALKVDRLGEWATVTCGEVYDG
jgi:hypothetical protein